MVAIIFWALVALYILLQLADCITTLQALDKGATEANPVLAKLMTCLGRTSAIVTMKLLAAAPLFFIDPSRPAVAVLLLLCVIYGLAVANNIRILRRLA